MLNIDLVRHPGKSTWNAISVVSCMEAVYEVYEVETFHQKKKQVSFVSQHCFD